MARTARNSKTPGRLANTRKQPNAKRLRTQVHLRKKPLQLPALTLSPRLTKVFSVLAVLMVLGGGGSWLSMWINNPENMRIEKVDWQGRFEYITSEELQLLVEPLLQTNLYLLDSAELESALDEHPWVRSVSLRKAWPKQLIIQVEEQYPVAFWGDEALLNQFGETFPATLPEKQGIFPLIYSPKTSGRKMGERYVELMRALQGLDLEIAELTEDERGSWAMRFRQGPLVVIGRRNQEKRLKRFKVSFLRDLRTRFDDIERIDLRYTNGLAVKWKRGVSTGWLHYGTPPFLRSLWS